MKGVNAFINEQKREACWRDEIQSKLIKLCRKVGRIWK